MMSPKLLTNFVTILKEMTEQDGVIYINQDELMNYLKPVSYNMEVLAKTKKFKGKDIIVTTALDLNGTPIKSLAPIKKVQGRLDISNTNVSSIEGIEVVGYTSYSNTPISRREEAERRAKIMRGIEERREQKVFDLELNEDSELAAKANAVFKFLEYDGDFETKEPGDEQRIEELRTQLERLEADRQSASGEQEDEIIKLIDEVESEITELEGRPDVYFIVPERYSFYDMNCFTSMIESSYGQEYCVGNNDEIDSTFRQYWDNYVDEVGTEGLSDWLIKDNLDMDRLRSDIEDVYENDIRDNPDAYLNDADKELSEAQKEEIQRLEQEKNELELRLHDLEPENEGYDEVTNRIDEIETEISEIEDSPDGEYTEESIQDRIDETVEYYLENYDEYFSNIGSNASDYLDKDSLVDYFMRNEDYGAMSSYDNTYDTVSINDETFYIIRQN